MHNLPPIPVGFEIADRSEMLTSVYMWAYAGAFDWRRTKYSGEEQPPYNTYIRPIRPISQQQKDTDEVAWIMHMIQLEETRGELPPGGASGNAANKNVEVKRILRHTECKKDLKDFDILPGPGWLFSPEVPSTEYLMGPSPHELSPTDVCVIAEANNNEDCWLLDPDTKIYVLKDNLMIQIRAHMCTFYLYYGYQTVAWIDFKDADQWFSLFPLNLQVVKLKPTTSPKKPG